jgi:transcriptional regulator with XRE-family HTH domain
MLQITDKYSKMTLKGYYEELGKRSTPQKEFRDLIARECGVTSMTVYRWLSGEITPDKLKRDKISEITGMTVEELFPNIKEDGTEGH